MQDNEIRLNPRVIVVQKLYGHHLNKDSELIFPKHRYKKFIKDVVNGTIERDEIIEEEVKILTQGMKEDEIKNKKKEFDIRIYVYA